MTRRKPRRGRIVDKEYLAWIHTQPCLVTGRLPVTAHHVRRFGEPKNDRRTIPLIASLHMRTCEKPGVPCVERGKGVFEKAYGVDLELAIVLYNKLYEGTSPLQRLMRTIAAYPGTPSELAKTFDSGNPQ